MSSKLKISKKTSQRLDHLSKTLDLRRNIVCRLAVGRSLAERSSVAGLAPDDSAGYEFNRYTLTGDCDCIFKAMVGQHEGKRIGDKEYFSKFIRNHIERGIEFLYREYLRINSPTDFFAGLLEWSE